MADHVEPTAVVPEIEASAAATEVFNSVKVSLADLCAKGTAQFAHKNYEEAADLFARASELQAELNGEMSPDNADILFLYGRSLFKVGQLNSDVLGGKSGNEKPKPKTVVKSNNKPTGEPTAVAQQTAEEGVAIIAQQNGGSIKNEDTSAMKPLFQFTGDENFEDSDDEEEAQAEENGNEEAAEEDDDMAVAFEVLDLARVLFNKKLETPEVEPASKGKGKVLEDSPTTKHIKERLADTHDLLAEISLENERFPGAVTDFRAALLHKQHLYAEESEIIAEAHFKLSLALEFASISKAKDESNEGDSATENDTFIDQGLRDEAVAELEAAIHSTKLKLQNKEVELASVHSPDDNDVTRAQIAEVKEIVSDMENRLAELKGPAINMKEALYGPQAVGGVLGAALRESPSEATARIEEAKKGATDLTGLIKRKKPASGIEKRKAEDDGDDNSDTKKVKVHDVTAKSPSESARVEGLAKE